MLTGVKAKRGRVVSLNDRFDRMASFLRSDASDYRSHLRKQQTRKPFASSNTGSSDDQQIQMGTVNAYSTTKQRVDFCSPRRAKARTKPRTRTESFYTWEEEEEEEVQSDAQDCRNIVSFLSV